MNLGLRAAEEVAGSGTILRALVEVVGIFAQDSVREAPDLLGGPVVDYEPAGASPDFDTQGPQAEAAGVDALTAVADQGEPVRSRFRRGP